MGVVAVERRGPADLLLFFITLVLLAIGLIMVLSASSYEAMIDYNDALHYFKRQLIFMALGFVFMFIMMNIFAYRAKPHRKKYDHHRLGDLSRCKTVAALE